MYIEIRTSSVDRLGWISFVILRKGVLERTYFTKIFRPVNSWSKELKSVCKYTLHVCYGRNVADRTALQFSC